MAGALFNRVKKMCLKQSSSTVIRTRLLNQLALLFKTGYFKRKLKAPKKAFTDFKAFARFFNKALVKKNFSKNAELLVLHSLVVTLLIGQGDERAVRRTVGKLLQAKLKLPNLSKTFESFPNFYARFLAFLPPVSSDGVKLTALLLKAV